MAVQISCILNGQQFFDNDGLPLNGGKIFVFSSGTTTPVNTWSDSSGLVLNTNPIVLDSSGRMQTEIWITSSTQVTFRLTLPDGTTVLEQWDNISGVLTGLNISSSDVTTALGYIPVNKAGDTMLGQLTLSGAPSTDLMAATKKYVDDAIAGVTAAYTAAIAAIQIPVGQIIMSGSATVPTGYLLCDGSPVSRTTYASLFTLFGTAFGPGDGSNTFNLPDLRGRFPRGADNGAGVDTGRALGSYQADDFKSHNHRTLVPADGHYNDGFAYYNPYCGVPGHAQWTIVGSDGDSSNTFLVVTDTVSTIPAAVDHPGLETRPKNVAVNFIVKY